MLNTRMCCVRSAVDFSSTVMNMNYIGIKKGEKCSNNQLVNRGHISNVMNIEKRELMVKLLLSFYTNYTRFFIL